MAGAAGITGVLEDIPGILKLVPAEARIAALSVIVLLVIVVAILRSDILGMLGRSMRERAIMFILRYVFLGTGVIIAISFSYAVFAKRLEAAELSNGYNKQVLSPTSTSLQPVPQPTDGLVNSLLILKSQLRPPPGIDNALAQLKVGNTKPAVDILTNNVLATQNENVLRAETLRHIGLLEFYKDTRASLAAYQQSVEFDPGSGEAWGQIANLLVRTGDFERATSAAQTVVKLGTENHDNNALGAGYAALGYIEASRGRKDQATPLLEKARGNFLAAGSYLQYAAATNNLASIAYSQGRFDEAIRNYEEALSKDTQINNPRGIAADYAGLGQVYLEQGREPRQFNKALEYFEKSVAANAGVGDPHQAALALSGKCSVYIARNEPGDLDKAKEACTNALSLEQQIENRSSEVFIMGSLAEIARLNHDLDAALKKYGEAIEMAKTFKLAFLEGSMQRGIGPVYSEQKKLVPALDAYRRAAEIDATLKLQIWLAYDKYWVGVTYTALGQKTDACEPLKQAADIFEQIGGEIEQEDAARAQAEANCT
jgi:tetratricopeptide (TPR) repeat protein